MDDHKDILLIVLKSFDKIEITDTEGNSEPRNLKRTFLRSFLANNQTALHTLSCM